MDSDQERELEQAGFSIVDELGNSTQNTVDIGIETNKSSLDNEKVTSVLIKIAHDVRSLYEGLGIKDPGSIDVEFIATLGLSLCESPQELQSLFERAKASASEEDGVYTHAIIKTYYESEYEKLKNQNNEDAARRLVVLGFDLKEVAKYLNEPGNLYKNLITSLDRILSDPIMAGFREVLRLEAGFHPMSLGEGLVRAREEYHRIN